MYDQLFGFTRNLRRPDILKLSDGERSSENIDSRDLRVVQLESTHGCKHPSLDSGATPIGSAGHAPDTKQFQPYSEHEDSIFFDLSRYSDEDDYSP
jgi:hypothetical protein